ncbi:MAG: hypothetical protein ACRDWE_07675, partial [Acidimicrobiales bacterium]
MMRSTGNEKSGTSGGSMHMLHRRSPVLRPAALGVAALGLLLGVLGVLGAGTGLAGAASHHHSAYSYAKYVGGHGKADKKLSPITIGVVNQQTGSASPAPEWTIGTQIAEKYLNQHTHGIDGHPVKLVSCKIETTVAAATKCGQEFA